MIFDLAPDRLETIAATYGTPLYLYDLLRVRAQYRQLEATLPASFTVHYALKANGSLALCQLLASLSCAADVSSGGELHTALSAGFAPQQIVFTSPGKTDEALDAAIAAGIGLIVVESLAEARRVEQYAARARRCQPILLRINPAAELTGSALPISSAASKFGVDEADAEATLAALADLPHVRCQGLHLFTESGVLDAAVLVAAQRYTIELANRLRDAGMPIEVLDFGGGIGVPYRPSERPFDLVAYGAAMESLLAANRYRYRYILELGRYLVAESGVYLTRVLDLKRSHGEQIVIVDGGIHHLYRPLMAHANALVEVVGRDAPPTMVASIHGLLPSPQDRLVAEMALPPVAIDDLLAIRNCGAYAYAHSLLGFVQHPTPAEVALIHGEIVPIRRRGTPADLLRNQLRIEL